MKSEYPCFVPDLRESCQLFAVQYISCWLVKYGLLCGEMFLLYLIWSQCFSWSSLNFVKCLSCIYWDDHTLFVLHSLGYVIFVNFEYVEPFLHLWDEFHMIMVNDLFNVLLDSICYLLKIFVSTFIKDISLWLSFLLCSFLVLV